MLRELNIKNLALIEELHITLGPGLVAITGETGAGKSIILQAIHLLAGGRGSAGWIRSGAESASVEALFEIAPERSELLDAVHGMGLDCDGDLVIRRIFDANGKSRYTINGAICTARMVEQISLDLLNVASQHDHQQLLAPRHHLDFVDAMGGLLPDRATLAARFERWTSLRATFAELQQLERDKEQRRDFLAFQCQEIKEACVVVGEDELLGQEKERLRAADDLLRLGGRSTELLAESVRDSLADVRRNLKQMAAFDPGVAELAEKVAGHSLELDDCLATLRKYIDNISNDPARLELVLERIDLLQRLKRKYGGTLEQVLLHAVEARKELDTLDAMDERLAALAKELATLETDLLVRARELSAARRRTAADLAATITAELSSLSFPQAHFAIEFTGDSDPGLEALHRTGWDRPEFMFSANPGEPVKPLAKIASGGELSRLMLALKCILARKDQVETVIFDEVDSGISGKAAEAVSRKIRELAGHHQVLCITHLPQIAAAADHHFVVAKEISDSRTRTVIAELGRAERVEALARMLAGEALTKKTLDYARELLERNTGNS